MWSFGVKKGKAYQQLAGQARKILSGKNYREPCYPLDDLLRIIVESIHNTERKVLFYKWFGFFLLVAIPLLSTVLSVALASDEKNRQELVRFLLQYAPYLSLALTVMTLLNSIFKPGERFQTACFISIQISHFKSDLLADLEKLPLPVDTEGLLKLVHRRRKEFESYQEQLIGLFLPETVRR